MSKQPISKDLFFIWRFARRGESNPENLTNPVWQWLAQTRMSAYSAAAEMNVPHQLSKPGWCFDRFGQSRTELPDGRIVWIAGEHEDHYDPDFFIYNDVAIEKNDAFEFLAYSPDVFPPTDFHSASLVDSRIILIGSLGYPGDRRPGETQVLTLDLDSWSVEPFKTVGANPGWIHRHDAQVDPTDKSILITSGMIDTGEYLVENFDDYRLHLSDGTWERCTHRKWPHWRVVRKDGKGNHLWHMRQVIWAREVAWTDHYEQELKEIRKLLKTEPALDELPLLYQPPIPHEKQPEREDEYNVFRIEVEGVVVRYVEESWEVRVVVEGDLPPDVVQVLKDDLKEKFERLEQCPAEISY